MILAIVAFILLFSSAVNTLMEFRPGNAIRAPWLDGVFLILSLLGSGLAAASLTFPEVWHPICLPGLLLLILGSLPLAILRLRFFLLAVRLQREGELAEPVDLDLHQPNRMESIHTYRYLDGRKGRSLVPWLQEGYLKVLYLPDNPSVHRLVIVKAASIPEQARPMASAPPTPSRSIPAEHGALTGAIQNLIDSPGAPFIIIEHKRTGKCVQVLGSPEGKSGFVLDVPFHGLDTGEIQRVRTCLEKVNREIRNSDLAIQTPLDEDAERVAAVVLEIFTTCFGLPEGAPLKVEFNL
jgi:hypothetical protein